MSPAAAAAPLPTKSEIQDWDTSYLDTAATSWRQAATASEDAFDQHRQNVDAPGGTTWEGAAKDAALDRVTNDIGVVGRQSGVLREAATLAENGAFDIKSAKDKAVEAITAAVDDGFTVGEDLSVTDSRKYDIDTAAERNRAAAEHAEDIRWAAQQLVQADQLVGNRLEAKAADLEGIASKGKAISEAGTAPTSISSTTTSSTTPRARTRQVRRSLRPPRRRRGRSVRSRCPSRWRTRRRRTG
ncbi:hypothetical protein H8Z59_12870 [Mycolicibacterium fortuitum]|uniref:hypothetical protein n=1 Tax=Mycolicibacterium fortuitum TaxID=1766 RepID=UPI001CDC9D2A|nr:hypothetical protein [Mycolicibacterium fortuitum]UBV23936.1 hypothetical protein H8Z59_12870 [Mycolicibacterium fortuitum]